MGSRPTHPAPGPAAGGCLPRELRQRVEHGGGGDPVDVREARGLLADRDTSGEKGVDGAERQADDQLRDQGHRWRPPKGGRTMRPVALLTMVPPAFRSIRAPWPR